MIRMLALVVALLPAVTALAGDLNQPPKEFTALFNGKDLAGWWGASTEDPRKYLELPADQLAKKKADSLADIQQHWSVKEGVLVNDGHGLYLTTDKNYGDFELLIEYKTVPKADSGIYLRGIPQVQIWDPTEEDPKGLGKAKGSGGLWNNSPGAPGKDPLVKADKPFGQWNKFRILMIGERVTVHFNGKLVVNNARMENLFDRTRPIPAAGPIQLQTHGGEIQWRNIFIRPITPEEANKALSQLNGSTSPVEQLTSLFGGGGHGFKPIFNGKNLNGWAGAVENYEVKDGAIVCKQGKGGNLYTQETYGDFVVDLQFKLPPGGNNGLAIRYPGQGSPHLDGMTELQVLDSEHPMYNNPDAPKYYKLDPRQAHGSVYGMIAAHRGYLRPTGQWNYQRVTVKGSTIKVELNGTVILDGDVLKVTEFMHKEPHKGLTLKSGHFGFAGHNDPVAFRNIRIKKLD